MKSSFALSIGIMADSHGNDELLLSAIRELKSMGAGQLFHLGDVCDSLSPHLAGRSLDILDEHGIRCVRGNNESDILHHSRSAHAVGAQTMQRTPGQALDPVPPQAAGKATPPSHPEDADAKGGSDRAGIEKSPAGDTGIPGTQGITGAAGITGASGDTGRPTAGDGLSNLLARLEDLPYIIRLGDFWFTHSAPFDYPAATKRPISEFLPRLTRGNGPGFSILFRGHSHRPSIMEVHQHAAETIPVHTGADIHLDRGKRYIITAGAVESGSSVLFLPREYTVRFVTVPRHRA